MADEDTTLHTVEVVNNDRGPRYLHSGRGPEIIQEGGALNTEMTTAQIDAAELAVIDGTDDLARFTITMTTGKPGDAGEGKALTDFTVPKLRRLADAEKADLGDARSKTEIIGKIEENRTRLAGTQG